MVGLDDICGHGGKKSVLVNFCAVLCCGQISQPEVKLATVPNPLPCIPETLRQHNKDTFIRRYSFSIVAVILPICLPTAFMALMRLIHPTRELNVFAYKRQQLLHWRRLHGLRR